LRYSITIVIFLLTHGVTGNRTVWGR